MLQINSAISLDRAKSQWVDLDIHTEACMTQLESWGAAGGAISVWVRVNHCPDWTGIISTYDTGTGYEIYCRGIQMRLDSHYNISLTTHTHL